MTNLPIYDKTGATVGSYEVDLDAMAPKISKQLVHDAIVMYQANLRQGSVKTKSRAEVAGSRKKMYRQKGTGNARAGFRQSPVWRGGGVAHGPKSRDFSVKVNKKVMKLAFTRAVSEKIAAGEIVVVDELTLAQPKTKLMN